MRLHDDGHFTAAVRAGRPVGFRLHGFQPLDFVPQGSTGLLEHAGQLELKPTPASQQGSLLGQLLLEDNQPLEGRRPMLCCHDSVDTAAINWWNGSRHFEADCNRGLNVPGKLFPGGRFAFEGLSPIPYLLAVGADGYVTESRTMRLRPGEDKKLEPITLQRKRTGQIRYIVSPDGDFRGRPIHHEPIAFDGKGWKAAGGKAVSFDCFPHRRGDTATFRFYYGPVFITALGPGSLEQARDVSVRQLALGRGDAPKELTMQRGQVYLMQQAHWGQWLLLTLSSLE
jgi:hypothetical protein